MFTTLFSLVVLLSPINPVESINLTLASEQMDMNNRFSSEHGNEIFKYNILTYLDYLDYGFTLQPNQTFCFHQQLLPEYKDKNAISLPLQFSNKEGFKSFGGLSANGICHLASLMNWAAQDAGLTVYAPTNHDFYPVPEVPREYGTSILYLPTPTPRTLNQNLYITNPYDTPVTFTFKEEENNLKLEISREVLQLSNEVGL